MRNRIDLEKHRKSDPKDKDRTIVTTVNITKEQKEWVLSRGLNLSSLIREFLTNLIKSTKE